MSWHRPNSTAGKITSPFGPRGPIAGAPDASRDHLGVDLRAGTAGVSSDVYAVTGGLVRRIYKTPLNAWVLELDHGGGVMTRYAHMQRAGIAVALRQEVRAGQRVAAASNSGAPTVHLHFEVLISGRQVDPVPYLQARGIDLTATTTSNGLSGVSGGGPLTAPTNPSTPDPLKELDMTPAQEALLKSVASAQEIVFFTSAGTTYEASLLAGTYRAFTNAQSYADRRYILDQAGIPYRLWTDSVGNPEVANPGAFGVRIGN